MEQNADQIASPLSYQDHLNTLFLFSHSVFREHLVVLLHKAMNPADMKDAVTLHSFMKMSYLDKKSPQWSVFGNWKKSTDETRTRIRNARNKYAAHFDSDIPSEGFMVTIEDVDILLDETLKLLDFLFENDVILSEIFTEEFGWCGKQQKPSEYSRISQNLMRNRIRFLKKVKA